MADAGLRRAIQALLEETDRTLPGADRTRDVADPGVGIELDFSREEVGAPVTPFEFLCYPTSENDQYGWNSAAQALDSSQQYAGTWYSPIVKVTQSGHTWGVECLDTGWPYWLGDLHDPEADPPVNDSVSWGQRIAADETIGWGNIYDLWDDQTLADSTSKTNLSAACRVHIGGTEYYRWLEGTSPLVVKQIPVAGGSVGTINITGVTNPAQAAFSASGERLAILRANYDDAYEVIIGQATSGSKAATMIDEPDHTTNTAYSDTNNGSTRTKQYDVEHRRPIGVGYDGETMQTLVLAVRERMLATYTAWDEATWESWSGGTLGSDYGVANDFTNLAPGRYYWALVDEVGGTATYAYWTIGTWRMDADGERERTMWLEQNGAEITTRVTTGYYKRVYDAVYPSNDPRYVGYDYSAPFDPYTAQFDVISRPCDLSEVNDCNGSDPDIEPLCDDCRGVPGGSERTKTIDAWHYATLYLPIDGVDAAGGVAVWIVNGKHEREYWFDDSTGHGGYTDTSDANVLAANGDGTLQSIGASPDVGAWGDWTEGTSQSNLEGKLEDYTDILDVSSQATHWAVAKKLSSGVVVWSARSNFSGGTAGQYTEVNGAVPTWLPAGASLAGHVRRGVTEAPCPAA